VSCSGRLRRPPLSMDSVVVATSGDLGYVLGTALFSAEGDPEATGARYVAIWRRIGGDWKLVTLGSHSHFGCYLGELSKRHVDAVHVTGSGPSLSQNVKRGIERA
jgi:hypothetical protein